MRRRKGNEAPTLEERIESEIPDAKEKMDQERADGTWTSLLDFYDKHRPAKAPEKKPGPKNLQEALAVIADMEARAEARAVELSNYRVSDAEQRVQSLERELDAERKETIKLRTQLARPELFDERFAELNKNFSDLQAKYAHQSSLMEKLERYSGLAGVPSADAIPFDTEPVRSSSESELEARLNKTTDPAERADILREYESAVRNGRLRK